MTKRAAGAAEDNSHVAKIGAAACKAAGIPDLPVKPVPVPTRQLSIIEKIQRIIFRSGMIVDPSL